MESKDLPRTNNPLSKEIKSPLFCSILECLNEIRGKADPVNGSNSAIPRIDFSVTCFFYTLLSIHEIQKQYTSFEKASHSRNSFKCDESWRRGWETTRLMNRSN